MKWAVDVSVAITTLRKDDTIDTDDPYVTLVELERTFHVEAKDELDAKEIVSNFLHEEIPEDVFNPLLAQYVEARGWYLKWVDPDWRYSAEVTIHTPRIMPDMPAFMKTLSALKEIQDDGAE